MKFFNAMGRLGQWAKLTMFTILPGNLLLYLAAVLSYAKFTIFRRYVEKSDTPVFLLGLAERLCGFCKLNWGRIKIDVCTLSGLKFYQRNFTYIFGIHFFKKSVL